MGIVIVWFGLLFYSFLLFMVACAGGYHMCLVEFLSYIGIAFIVIALIEVMTPSVFAISFIAKIKLFTTILITTISAVSLVAICKAFILCDKHVK